MPAIPERLAWAVAQIQAAATGRILEVGCGNGLLLGLLAAQVPCAQIVGIDRSLAQVQRARQKLDGIAPAQRPQVEHSTLSEASRRWAEAPFATVIAVNVNAFWVNPRHAIPQLRAVVAPGGRAYLVYEPPSRARAQALERDLPSQLQSGGLIVETVRTTRFRTDGIGLCFTATRRID